jgi:hypothetical protein
MTTPTNTQCTFMKTLGYHECSCGETFKESTPDAIGTDTMRQQTDISLELLEMFMHMMTTKNKEETYYINTISEKVQSLLTKEKTQLLERVIVDLEGMLRLNTESDGSIYKKDFAETVIEYIAAQRQALAQIKKDI